MKATIQLFLLTLLFNFKGFSQSEPYLKDNIFYTTFESGAGIKTNVTFSVNQEILNKLDSFEVFKNYENETYNNPANEGYLKKWSKLSHVELFLMSETNTASFMAKLKLKNGTSYTPIENSKGNVFFMPEGKKMIISFPFKAQNGRGDMIMSRCYHSISWDGSKKISDTRISE